ncbi:MAG: cell wall hydrolase [Parvularcula sp.]|jgi:spore germination cell wall hydrolase CwlJ-like protein|nr:cell wall hydrolase [Parvularcula sp.]
MSRRDLGATLLLVAAVAAAMQRKPSVTVRIEDVPTKEDGTLPTAYEVAMQLPKGSREREAILTALTLWGEARGEDELGRKAVASVIVNRTNDRRWGNLFEDVVMQKWQFEPWNEGTAARRKLEAVTIDDRTFQQVLRIAEKAVDGVLEDVTNGADHFFATWMTGVPTWAAKAVASLTIGRHRFLRIP